MAKKRTQYRKKEISFFIYKLVSILDDQRHQQIISWSSSGNEFLIHNEGLLINSILPQYFKHHNMASFVRQLNLYGFHKLENNSSYAHPCFKRDDRKDIGLIKREVGSRLKNKKMLAKNKKKDLQLQNQELEDIQEENQLLKESYQKMNSLKEIGEKALLKIQEYRKNVSERLAGRSSFTPEPGFGKAKSSLEPGASEPAGQKCQNMREFSSTDGNAFKANQQKQQNFMGDMNQFYQGSASEDSELDSEGKNF